MELRQLQYAIQIATEKNFSRAAEKLHIAQPSLSQQLSKLEKEIGVLLFQRNTNSVEVTHAGSVFVEKAQIILDRVAQLKKEMEDISQMRKGKLVVGSLPITGSHILPLVLPVFHANYPEIEVVLIEDTSANLESLISSGQTDISLLTLPLEEASLSCQTLIEEEICLAVPPQHPLAQTDENRRISVADLKNEPFILLKKGQGFRTIALDLCRRHGFEPHIVFESSNIGTVQSLVAAGMGIAFVPSMIAKQQAGSFTPVYRHLEGAPFRTLVIAYRKGRYLSKAAEAFISTLTDVVK
ncbi:LysR family transcriptional regulator [Paenibacillus aurantius]|uniref:LysR family transcriptional regulator n=1 Tax=Paenibacillus aurantius TaxID=2918900 RepID=A0AA96LCH1_9BACL|nr:LysR family transcriptional regulator [Paenibacillus aurantius]WJH34152.1 LysR family transcriptional regulator [Paenibacillus sp. CC-CFT747]WNQ09227.1 LysR family transcriptional regulator [Paenibacillus aurantius]